MFTDRFLKVPISIYNVKDKELTGKENLEDSWYKFLPFELASYRPTYFDNDSSNQDCTTIFLKNGEDMIVNMTTKEFEKLINDHQK